MDTISVPSEVDARKRLLQILLNKSYREGKFTLTSGKDSLYYIDCKVTVLNNEGAFLTGLVFIKEISRSFPEAVAVAGLTLGADPIVAEIAMFSYINPECQNLNALIIRKEAKGHGTKKFLEGTENVPPGSKVVVVDDVSTTGGSLSQSVERVEAAGYNVVGVISLVERQEGAVEDLKKLTGHTLRSIFFREEITALKES